MKNILLILFFLPILSIGQNFQLSDTVFQVGERFRTYNIKYSLDNGVRLKEETEFYLDTISDFLIRNKFIVIEIGNFVDSCRESEDCYKITRYRAESIKDYFILKGINPKRIIAKGYGDTMPIINKTEQKKIKTTKEIEQARKKNTRTEFKIISLNYKE